MTAVVWGSVCGGMLLHRGGWGNAVCLGDKERRQGGRRGGGGGGGGLMQGNGGRGHPPFKPVSAAVLKRTYSNACCTLSATAYPPRPLIRGVAPLGVAAMGVEPPLAMPEVEVRPSRNAAMT